VSGFQNLLKSSVAYIKGFLIKRVVSISQDESTMLRTQTTTIRTAGIPTRPGSSYQLLVPRHELSVIIELSQIHYSWNRKRTTV